MLVPRRAIRRSASYTSGLTLLLLLGACHEATAPASAVRAQMTATIAGAPWRADFLPTSAEIGVVSGDGRVVQVLGSAPTTGGNQQAVFLVLRPFTGPGTYALGPANAGKSYLVYTVAPNTAAPNTAAPNTVAPNTAAPNTAAPNTAASNTAGTPTASGVVLYSSPGSGAGAVTVTQYDRASGRIVGTFRDAPVQGRAPAAALSIADGAFSGVVKPLVAAPPQ